MLLVVTVAALTVVSPIGLGVTTSGSGQVGSASIGFSVPSSSAVPAASAPLHGGGSSGPGIFYNDTVLPLAAAAVAGCYNATCVNATTDPSINLTATGVLAVAYTSYSDVQACGSTFTEIAVVTSTDLGSTWSVPTYLNNPECSSGADYDSDYNNSWEPSLTSLPNGTLVLAYVQYSTTGYPAPSLEWVHSPYYPVTAYNVPYDRLVVTDLYAGKTSWTTPTVVNESVNPALTPGYFASPIRPSIAAFGDTVYLAWTSVGNSPFADYTLPSYPPVGNMNVSFSTSTKGGPWSAPVNLATEQGPTDVGTGSIPAAFNPTITVLPNGQLTIAYVGNVTAYGPSNPFCEPNFCQDVGYDPNAWSLQGAEIEVARSTTNGTSFQYSTVPLGPTKEPLWIVPSSAGGTVGVMSQRLGIGQTQVDAYPLLNPAPSMTYDAASGQVYIATEAGNLSEADHWYQATTVFVTNSSDDGSSWSAVRQVDPSLLQPGASNQCAYDMQAGVSDCFSQAGGQATIVVENGTLVVAFSYYDYQQCGTISSGATQCGTVEELFYRSTDGGMTFTPDGIDNNLPTIDDALYAGAAASAIGTGDQLWVAWTRPWCPNWAAATCEWPQLAPGGPQVVVTQPFTGTGVTVTFTETGLPSGTDWNLAIAGNLRSGTAPSSLSISGVPTGAVVAWSYGEDGLLNSSTQYGTRFVAGTPSPASPAAFSSASTVSVEFTTQYLIGVASDPGYPSCDGDQIYGGFICWDDEGESEINYNLTITGPGFAPGTSVGFAWVDAGASVTMALTNNPLWVLNQNNEDLNEVNLSFEAWEGTGASSVSSSALSITVPIGSPINETAAFAVIGECSLVVSTSGTTGGCGLLNYTVTFSETGLPAGTEWGATTTSSVTDTFSSNESTASSFTISNASNLGAVTYRVWSVPAMGGEDWIPTTTSPASPIVEPGQSTVAVEFGLASPSSVAFPVEVQETGLPANVSSWSLSLGSTAYGVTGSTANLTLSGGSYLLGAPTVYTSAGTAFYLKLVTEIPNVVNLSWQNLSASPTASVNVEGPAIFLLEFAPEYYLTVLSGVGGSVTPGSQWIPAGGSVTLTATPDSNYSFVSWSGVAGSTDPTVVVTPSGPGPEIATFEHLPSPTYVAIVDVTGLPGGVSATVTLGSGAYSSPNATFDVGGLNGTYALSVPVVYANANTLSRFAPESVTTTFPVSSGLLEVTGGGWINITYEAQYAVALAAIGNGSVSPSPGLHWYNASQSVNLTASPWPGNEVVAWTGWGTGSVNSTRSSITITVDGPMGESAVFAESVSRAPATFALTVDESGLPSGATWSFSLGTLGDSGVASGLVLTGLNGSYVLTVPDVYSGTGTRYVANFTERSIGVTDDRTVAVTFSTQYWVGVESSTGGTATSSVAGWVNASTSVTFSAVAQAGWSFAGWTGVGSGSTTSTTENLTLSITGPTTEAASFAPTTTTTSPSTSSNPWASNALPLDLALLVGLFVVGFLVLFLLTRRRREPPAAEAPVSSYDESASEGGAEPAQWVETESTTEDEV